MSEANPLSGYFRQPGMHVTLPTKGVFVDPNDLELSMTGELAVFPMTARDEQWSRNPDGLLNGNSIERIILSCVPGVKNPRFMPTQDIDFLLLAIKKVSYGNTLKISAKCPKCDKEHDYECSIDEIMSTVKSFEPVYEVRLNDDLVARIRPYNYEATTKQNLAAFEEAKIIQALLMTGLDQHERLTVFSSSFDKIATLHLSLLADTVMSITTPEGEITDRVFIAEFIENADKSVVDALREGLKQFEGLGINRNIELVCAEENCGHSWQTELSFDPSHFFA